MTGERIRYGADPSQHGVLHRPAGDPRGVVVVIHGGFWKAQYDASLGEPLARDLAGRGWLAWNIEYRRVGNGGGTPETFDDVLAALDHLTVLGLDGARVVTLGHSAGGHLAVWAAGASDRVSAAISQGGVLDLVAAHDAGLGGGAVAALLGHPPTAGDAGLDPMQQAPIGAPVRCVHGTHDDEVPVDQARAYVARAQAAGGDAQLLEHEGGHYEHLDTTSVAWGLTVRALESL